MREQTLTQAGLETTQAAVYEALIKQGAQTASQISQKTPYKREYVYKILEELIKMGLVARHEEPKKIALFRAEHPQKLQEMAEIREKEFKKSHQELISVIPTLISDFNLVSGRPGIRFFEGLEGIKKVYEDTLKQESDIYAIVATEKPDPVIGKWVRENYVKRRVKKGNKAYVIASSAKEAEGYKDLDESELRETRIVPQEKFPFEMEIDIYGENKVSFISYKTEELIGVIIESAAIYKTMKAFFDLAWSNIKSD